MTDHEREIIDRFFDDHPDIKPCPFCGAKDENIYIHWKSGKGGLYYFIKCSICKGSGGAYADIEAAYEHWQSRSP